MAIGRLPIARAALVGYQDVLRAAQVMRAHFLIALLIILLVRVANNFLSHGSTAAAFGITFWIARSILLTPILVAVHRFILLDEATDRYAIEPYDPRFFRFLFWSLALSVWLYGPGLLLLTSSLFLGLPAIIAFIGLPICLVIGVVVGLRLSILFPAIAVDAPGGTAANSIADTRGFAIDIFLIYLLAFLPIGAAEWLLRRLSSPIVVHAVGMILDVAALVLLVVIASRIFQAVADRTLRPASA